MSSNSCLFLVAENVTFWRVVDTGSAIATALREAAAGFTPRTPESPPDDGLRIDAG
jgi:hypothetical protein